MPDTEPKVGHDQFPNFPYNSVFTNHPIIQRCITSVADVIVVRNTATTYIVLCELGTRLSGIVHSASGFWCMD